MSHNIKISCSTGNLKEIRDFVSKTLEEFGVSETDISLMVLAVDEVCANLIIHSNKNNENQNLEVVIKEESDGFVFEIFDSGAPFDPYSYPVPNIKDLVKSKKKGGIGLMLVKQIMDSIELIKQDKFTIYRLFKKSSIAPL